MSEKANSEGKELSWYAMPLSAIGYTIPPLAGAYVLSQIYGGSTDAATAGLALGTIIDILVCMRPISTNGLTRNSGTTGEGRHAYSAKLEGKDNK